MLNWKQDFALAMLLLAMGAVFWAGVAVFPEDAQRFPRLLSVFLCALALYMAFGALRRRHREEEPFSWRPYRKVVLQVLCIAAFAVLLRPLGYALAGFLLCLCTAFNGGYPRKGVAVLFSLGVALIVFTVFTVALKVPLPMGILESGR